MVDAAQLEQDALDRCLVVAVREEAVVEPESAEEVAGIAARALAQGGKVAVQPAMVLGDGPAVVVHDHDDARAQLRQAVQTLEREAARQRPVTHDGDHVIRIAREVARLGHAAHKAHGRGRVAHGVQVVLGLIGIGEPGETAELLGVQIVRSAAREHLMRVRLMRDVEDQFVDRRVEDAVQGDRELDDSQVGAYVTAH